MHSCMLEGIIVTHVVDRLLSFIWITCHSNNKHNNNNGQFILMCWRFSFYAGILQCLKIQCFKQIQLVNLMSLIVFCFVCVLRLHLNDSFDFICLFWCTNSATWQGDNEDVEDERKKDHPATVAWSISLSCTFVTSKFEALWNIPFLSNIENFIVIRIFFPIPFLHGRDLATNFIVVVSISTLFFSRYVGTVAFLILDVLLVTFDVECLWFFFATCA